MVALHDANRQAIRMGKSKRCGFKELNFRLQRYCFLPTVHIETYIFFSFFQQYSLPLHKINIIMDIVNSQFVISAPNVNMCPSDNKPEFAFIGRSNVGKSSLINMLCNHKGLAKTSATPGKTLLVNHFIINKEWYLVDLPGYGYAKRSKTEIKKLDQMIRGYILQREQLVNVFVLVDIRLEPQKIDLEFINWLGESSVPFSIVFTKADKLNVNKVNASVALYQKTLSETWEEMPRMFITSSEKKTGRDEVLGYIEEINKELSDNV